MNIKTLNYDLNAVVSCRLPTSTAEKNENDLLGYWPQYVFLYNHNSNSVTQTTANVSCSPMYSDNIMLTNRLIIILTMVSSESINDY